jgi:hypothetical protein
MRSIKLQGIRRLDLDHIQWSAAWLLYRRLSFNWSDFFDVLRLFIGWLLFKIHIKFHNCYLLEALSL